MTRIIDLTEGAQLMSRNDEYAITSCIRATKTRPGPCVSLPLARLRGPLRKRCRASSQSSWTMGPDRDPGRATFEPKTRSALQWSVRPYPTCYSGVGWHLDVLFNGYSRANIFA